MHQNQVEQEQILTLRLLTPYATDAAAGLTSPTFNGSLIIVVAR
jgi:hypothetical protein